MSPDRKHRQSHRRRPCRTHCPDRKVWAAFPPPIAPKVVGNTRIALARAVVTAFRRPRKVHGVTLPAAGPPTSKCSPPCGRKKCPTVLPCGVVRQAAARRCAAESVPESPARGVSSPAAVSARRSPPARWSRILDLLPRRSAAACCGGACTSVADRSRSPKPVSVVPKSIRNPSPGNSSSRPISNDYEQESRRDRQRIEQAARLAQRRAFDLSLFGS